MEAENIVVIGGGPAGMMAAIRASKFQKSVILIEKNPTLGCKLLLSGKGRCNLTNLCDLDKFFLRFSHHGQFLRDAFKNFFHRDLIRFFEERGLGIKVERQLRVFPKTDRSDSILEILKKELARSKVKIIYQAAAKEILTRQGRVSGLLLAGGETIAAKKIILATGGLSYRFTGSTGEGMEIAARLGHQIVPPKPGLVPLETRQLFPKKLSGLTLKNIRLKVSNGEKELVSEIGELLFCGFGISGPLVLSFSGQIADWLSAKKPVSVEIDLKPALSEEQLQARLLREFKLNSRKNFKNTLKSLLPKKLADIFAEIAGINPDKKVSHITKEERGRLLALLKGWRLDITRARPLDEAMVTRGGIALKEINPRTMESRRISGLYFAGEIIDIDADTGGFNLQAAFSTGYLAGESAGQAN